MSRRAATLRDVAEKVGVHLSTVSRALDPRTRHLITPELALRIQGAAQELSYRPNALAYSLRTRRSRSIGVLVPDITNPIFPPIVRGLEDVLAPQHYVTLVINTDDDAAKTTEAVAMLRGRGVDALVVACATRQDPMIAGLLAAHVPVIAVNRVAELPGLGAVVHDDAQGMQAIIAHLVALGHRRIGHIAGPGALSTSASRLSTFHSAMARHGLLVHPALVLHAQRFCENEGQRCATRLLALAPRPTAIVGGNDLLALGALRAVREAGLSCPRDISITGYNDMPFVDRLDPPLTTVRIASYEAGRLAAQLVLRQIEGGGVPTVEVLPVELVVRGSTGPVAG